MRSRISGRPMSAVSIINEATEQARREFEAAARAPVSARLSPYVKWNTAMTKESVLTKGAIVSRDGAPPKSAPVRTNSARDSTVQKMKTEIQLLETKLKEQTQLRERDRRRQQEVIDELMDTNRRLQTQNERLVDGEYSLLSRIADLTLRRDELRTDNGRLNLQLVSLKSKANGKSVNSPYALVFKILSNNTLIDATDPAADEPINNPAFMCPITREGIAHAVVLDCDHVFDSQSLHANWNHADRKNHGKCPCCRRGNRKIVFEGNVARGAVALN